MRPHPRAVTLASKCLDVSLVLLAVAWLLGHVHWTVPFAAAVAPVPVWGRDHLDLGSYWAFVAVLWWASWRRDAA